MCFRVLLFVQETAIELVVIGQDGDLESVCEQHVFGTIKDMKMLHYNERYHGKKSQVDGFVIFWYKIFTCYAHTIY